GAVTVKLDLPPQVVMAHLGTAMLVLATLLMTATLASPYRLPKRMATPAAAARFYALALWTTVGTFVLLMSGALVTGSGAASACSDWPLCRGLAIPVSGLPAIHFTHRLVALVVGALIVYTTVKAMRRKAE